MPQNVAEYRRSNCQARINPTAYFLKPFKGSKIQQPLIGSGLTSNAMTVTWVRNVRKRCRRAICRDKLELTTVANLIVAVCKL